MLALGFLVLVLAGPDDPAVQRPRGGALSPPDAAAVPLEAPSSPEPEPEPEPAPAPAEAPTPAPAPPAVVPFGPEPAVFDPALARDYVRVDRPRFTGSGLLVTGGILALTAGLKQVIQASICGVPYCGLPAATERALIVGSVAMTAGGAFRRGRWDAYADTIAAAPDRPTRARKIAGWTMAAVGAAGLVLDLGFHGACLHDRSGPYVDGEWGCREWASALLMNASAVLATVGTGLGTWASKYERDRRFYRGARVVPVPLAGRGQAGLSLAGFF